MLFWKKIKINFLKLFFYSISIEAWLDLEKAIDMAKEFDDKKVLALALAQKGTLLRLKGN